MLLEVRQVSKSFTGVQALRKVDLAVEPGEIRALIGPNGSGKTTLINAITGVYPPTSGRVIFAGRDITGLAPFRVARVGVARTFQNLRLFPTLSVLDHVRLGMDPHASAGFFRTVFQSRSGRLEEASRTERARELLAFVGLQGREDMLPGSLPYGQRRLLEIARALATGSRLLLLDEPAAGLSSGEIQQLERLLRAIQAQGFTVLLVEHRMLLVMNVADRISVLNYGEKIAEGAPAEVRRNPQVIEAYLGREYQAAPAHSTLPAGSGSTGGDTQC